MSDEDDVTKIDDTIEISEELPPKRAVRIDPPKESKKSGAKCSCRIDFRDLNCPVHKKNF